MSWSERRATKLPMLPDLKESPSRAPLTQQIAEVPVDLEATVDVWPEVVLELATVVNHAVHVVKEMKNSLVTRTNKNTSRVKKITTRPLLVKDLAVVASEDVSVEDTVHVISTVLAVTPTARKSWINPQPMDPRMEVKNSSLVVPAVPHATECEVAVEDVDVLADIMDAVAAAADPKEMDKNHLKV